jgi:hypothetical protein
MALKPKEYAYADRAMSDLLGLPAKEAEDDGICYGLLFCETNNGQHVTVATPDVTYWRMIRDVEPKTRAGLTLPPEKFPYRRDGWPDEWVQ